MAGEIPEQRRGPVYPEPKDIKVPDTTKEGQDEGPPTMGVAQQRLKEALGMAEIWAHYLVDHGLSQDEVDGIVLDALWSHPHLGAGEGIITWRPRASRTPTAAQSSEPPAKAPTVRVRTEDGRILYDASVPDLSDLEEGAEIARQALAELRRRTEPLPQGI